jgi:hypothetical protein
MNLSGPFGDQWSENWVYMAGSTGDEITTSIVGSNTEVFVIGNTLGNLFEALAGGQDAFVIRLGPGGTASWTRQFGGPGNDRPSGIALDPSRDVFVTGSTDGRLGTGLTVGFGGMDQFVAKLSHALGTLQ